MQEAVSGRQNEAMKVWIYPAVGKDGKGSGVTGADADERNGRDGTD